MKVDAGKLPSIIFEAALLNTVSFDHDLRRQHLALPIQHFTMQGFSHAQEAASLITAIPILLMNL